MSTGRIDAAGFGAATRGYVSGGEVGGTSQISTETFDGTSWSGDTNLPAAKHLAAQGMGGATTRGGYLAGGNESSRTNTFYTAS